MIKNYEIPSGSKLYFGRSAKKKRDLESNATSLFYEEGFEEIVTPNFSYHQELIAKNDIVNFSDTNNHTVNLRADSAQDVVRLIINRLGRSTEHKKWFYIQPIFKYPTTEIHQIGAEWINNPNLEEIADVVTKLLLRFKTPFSFQLGNIKIPKLISELTDIPMEHFIDHNIEMIASFGIDWVNQLIGFSSVEDIKSLPSSTPPAVLDELKKMERFVAKSKTGKIILTPLFYAQFDYYDELFFRLIDGNRLLAMGGSYSVSSERASGFAVYTDELL